MPYPLKTYLEAIFNRDGKIITLELIGWQTKDVYQNTALTVLSSISKNQNIEKKLFKLPSQN